eukprot:COSAG02_NODE_3540_length_6589_cov_2.383513_3_plen_86_part_00
MNRCGRKNHCDCVAEMISVIFSSASDSADPQYQLPPTAIVVREGSTPTGTATTILTYNSFSVHYRQPVSRYYYLSIVVRQNAVAC